MTALTQQGGHDGTGEAIEMIDISYLILSSDLIISLISLRSYIFVIYHMTFIQMTDEHCSCFTIG